MYEIGKEDDVVVKRQVKYGFTLLLTVPLSWAFYLAFRALQFELYTELRHRHSLSNYN